MNFHYSKKKIKKKIKKKMKKKKKTITTINKQQQQ